MKTVYKFGTGDAIPIGAKYLTTLVEWDQGTRWEPVVGAPDGFPKEEHVYYKRNKYVWHYYEVEMAPVDRV